MSERELFLAALQIADPQERSSWLDRACAGDAVLRQRIDVLLQALDKAGSLLDNPVVGQQASLGETDPGEAAANEPSSAEVGQGSLHEGPGAAQAGVVLAGRYKLVEHIGEGGMGTVWMAQQTEPVKRPVAVKLIKRGMDSKQVLARFEAERQALALMDHPSIARVLDAGATATGRPYFVMELVKGAPLTRYCDEHRLTPRQRLELFVSVCQAVQHAHQKGIIHRDLKPSNILVAQYDGRPVPKVIDFGIAKAAGQQLTDKTLMTGFGAVVGTLEYMSPEQAELNQLDIDTRSDIYSLGVLLYELLTGSTPLEKKRLKEAALLEVLRVIREEEPPRPSTRLSTTDELPSVAANRGLEPRKLSGLVRGELDWIVMKALEKDRNRRYETANGFAQDVQRYLADEPVLACPPSMAYRLRKLARRNRTGLTAAALVGLALVLGTAVSIWQAVWATQARDAEIAARIAEREARDELDTAREEQERRRTGTDRELSEALVEAVRLQAKVRTARSGDPESAHQLRTALGRAGTLAASELADPALVARVRALQAEVSQDEKDRRMVARLEEIRLNQGKEQGGLLVTVSGGTAPAYEAAFRDYGIPLTDFMKRALQGRFGNPPARREVEEAARQIAASPIRDWLVAALDDCASNQWYLMQQLLPIARRVEENDPWRRQYFDARIHGDREAIARLANQPEALKQPPAHLVEVAQNIESPHNQNSPPTKARLLREAQRQHPADLWINRMLAECAWSDQGTPDECIGFLRVALAARPDSLALHLQLAGALRGTGRQDEAIAVCRQAVRLKPDNANAYIALARMYLPMRPWVKAHSNLDDAIVACRKALQIDPKDTRASSLWAIALLIKGEPDGAVALLQKSADADPKSAGRLYAEFASELMPIYQQAIVAFPSAGGTAEQPAEVQKRLHEIEAAYRKAIECAMRLGDNSNELNRALSMWMSVPRPQQDWDGARATWRKLIELKPQAVTWQIHQQLGGLLAGSGDWDGAIAAYRAASRGHPSADKMHFDCLVAGVLRSKGNLNEAIAIYRKAIKVHPESSEPRLGLAQALAEKPEEAVAAAGEWIRAQPRSAEPLLQRARLYQRLNRWEEALADFSRATEADPSCGPTVWAARAPLYTRLQQWDKAVTDYSKLVEQNPQNAGALSGRANAHFQLRMWEKAAEDYTRLLAVAPGNSWAWLGRGAARANAGRYEEAVADYSRAIDLLGTNALAWHNRALALPRLGRWERAAADHARALELTPRSDWQNDLAWVLATCPKAKVRNPARAVVLAQKAVDANPKVGTFWLTLGVARYRAGDFKGAVEAFDRSMALRQSGDAFDWLPLAKAHARLGQPGEARKWYDRAAQWLQKNEKALARDTWQAGELRRFRDEAEEVLGLKKK
jgi:tetratricopeptide (TPR) repeat protein